MKTNKNHYIETQLGWGTVGQIEKAMKTKNNDYFYLYSEYKFIFVTVYQNKMNGVHCGPRNTYRISRNSTIKLPDNHFLNNK